GGAAPAVAEAAGAARRKVRRALSPAEPGGHLGKLRRACESLPQAAACFAQAERLDPGDPRWPYLRGEALLLRDPGAALPHLQRAVGLCDRGGADVAAPRPRPGGAHMDAAPFE